jgi:hypothetical protein
MTGAPLGKSLVELTLNKKPSAASGNSIHAGGSGLNETGVTPKGRRFQNALLLERRSPLAPGLSNSLDRFEQPLDNCLVVV